MLIVTSSYPFLTLSSVPQSSSLLHSSEIPLLTLNDTYWILCCLEVLALRLPSVFAFNIFFQTRLLSATQVCCFARCSVLENLVLAGCDSDRCEQICLTSLLSRYSQVTTGCTSSTQRACLCSNASSYPQALHQAEASTRVTLVAPRMPGPWFASLAICPYHPDASRVFNTTQSAVHVISYAHKYRVHASLPSPQQHGHRTYLIEPPIANFMATGTSLQAFKARTRLMAQSVVRSRISIMDIHGMRPPLRSAVPFNPQNVPAAGSFSVFAAQPTSESIVLHPDAHVRSTKILDWAIMRSRSSCRRTETAGRGAGARPRHRGCSRLTGREVPSCGADMDAFCGLVPSRSYRHGDRVEGRA